MFTQGKNKPFYDITVCELQIMSFAHYKQHILWSRFVYSSVAIPDKILLIRAFMLSMKKLLESN